MLTMKQNLIVNLFLVDVKLFLGIAVIPAIFGYAKVFNVSNLFTLCYRKIRSVRLMRAQDIVRVSLFVSVFNVVHVQEICDNNFL